jgi:hypothetical protein
MQLVRRRRAAAVIASVGLVAGLLVSYGAGAAPAAATPTTGLALVTGDWDGDGRDTIASFDAGWWTLYPDQHATEDPTRVGWARAGDLPFAGDWDGDGRDDLGVRRGDRWYVRVGGTTGTFAFGVATDVPVIGDWDGDGVDGVGVVRGDRWYLRETPRGGVPSRTFRFGVGGDRPVIGDWDGDGSDGIGVVRGRRWFFRSTPSGGAADLSRLYGTAGDVPMAGDWDGDGADGIAVVRHRAALLSQLPVSDASAGVETAWMATRAAGSCPRGTPPPGHARSAVAPRSLDLETTVHGPSSDGRDALLEAVRYQLTTAWDAGWAIRAGVDHVDVRGTTRGRMGAERALRPPAMAAAAIAIALRTDAYDGSVVTRSRRFAVEHVRRVVRSLACSHRATSAGGWPNPTTDGGSGATWQSAMWARSAGVAGWLLWDELLPGERSAVAAMVAAEADRVASLRPRSWQRRDGSISTPGDSGFEEAAWNGSLVQLASAMMPLHANAATWRSAAVRHGVGATATLADTRSRHLIAGRPTSQWVDGANVAPTGTVDNHGAHAHPDYMSSIRDVMGGSLFTALAGQPVPPEAAHNAALVYGALRTVTFAQGASVRLDADPAASSLYSSARPRNARRAPAPDPATADDIDAMDQADQPGPLMSRPFHAPGGTIYRPDGSVYYPNPSVWGGVGVARFVAVDELAGLLGVAPDADLWSARHIARTRLLQLRSPDGRTYISLGEFPYTGAEQHDAEALAQGWLARYVRVHGLLADAS